MIACLPVPQHKTLLPCSLTCLYIAGVRCRTHTAIGCDPVLYVVRSRRYTYRTARWLFETSYSASVYSADVADVLHIEVLEELVVAQLCKCVDYADEHE
jgi:hypothetical protein